ncbi:MAG: acetyl-CoA carboxylase biotin carboxyl carrier protein subunit [Bdellovibrio sp.]|nr:acetyl-CoA carboxylase biotin carboxyl carrier protein subunit [Bdellovibrio sp.]
MEKKIILDGKEVIGDLTTDGKRIEILIKDQRFDFELVSSQGDLFILKNSKDGQHRRLNLFRTSTGQLLVDFEGRSFVLEETQGRVSRPKNVDFHPRAPMPGKIMKILKNQGDAVKKGDALIIMEAMKMEHTIRAGRDAKIKEIFCRPGDLVSGGMDLLAFESEGQDES